MKPEIFIGSSTEGIAVAHAIQENLEHDALCSVWSQGIFELSGNTLENLIKALDRFQFAIFVVSPDDFVEIRSEKYSVARDNVILELGLFIGRLGLKRVFFAVPRNRNNLRIPTDLLGITAGMYDDLGTPDLLASLGPFCNKVRRQITEVMEAENEGKKLASQTNDAIKFQEKPSDEKKENEAIKEKMTEYGVFRDRFNNFQINIDPCDFFHNRLSKAFPGIRGLEYITNPKLIVDRLLLLFKPPIIFERAAFDGISQPLWWFRDYSSMYIQDVRKLSETKILLNHDELEINRIAVYHPTSYYRSFIYLEAKAVPPSGLDDIPQDNIESARLKGAPFTEEIALFENKMIRRVEYDDGAAVIDGEVVDVYGSELRVRHLAPYNFIITGQTAPANSRQFEQETEKIFNGLLTGTHSVEDLTSFLNKLPNRSDHWRGVVNK